MPMLEDVKKAVEKMTGFARPDRGETAGLVRMRKPNFFRFQDDGATPNNPRLPLILYRSPVRMRGDFDPAAIFEELFAANGWGDSWRDGIYDFLHFHTRTHEVLGIARGTARVEFGGARGKVLELKTGDVAILPAGTGHRRQSGSRDLLVVGAYPAAGKYDQPTPGEADHHKAIAAIAKVAVPPKDPVYGKGGPLNAHWRSH